MSCFSGAGVAQESRSDPKDPVPARCPGYADLSVSLTHGCPRSSIHKLARAAYFIQRDRVEFDAAKMFG